MTAIVFGVSAAQVGIPTEVRIITFKFVLMTAPWAGAYLLSVRRRQPLIFNFARAGLPVLAYEGLFC